MLLTQMITVNQNDKIKVQYVSILVKKIKKSIKMINILWINNSSDIMKSMCYGAEVFTEVSMLTS